MRQVLGFTIGNGPAPTVFLIPIILSAYVGGLGSGLVSTGVATVVANYFLLAPKYAFSSSLGLNSPQWVSLILVGTLISVLFKFLHRSRRARRLEYPHGRQYAAERKVQMGFAIALVLLSAIGVISYLSLDQQRDDAAQFAHTHEVIADLRSLLSTTIEAEIAQHGYVITGDEGLLELYHDALEYVDGITDKLRILTTDNAAQQYRLDTLATLMSARFNCLLAVLELRHQQGLEAISATRALDKGKKLQGDIRNILGEMEAEEQALLRQRRVRAQQSNAIAKGSVIGGSLAGFFLVTLALFAIGQDLSGIRRVEAALCEAHSQLETTVQERTAELVQANASLQAGERQLRLITDALPALLSYIDRNMFYQFNNRAYEQWFGHPRAEIHGKQMEHVLGLAAYETIAPHIEKALAGQAVTYETIMPYRDGGTRYIHGSYIPDIGTDGQVEGFFGLITDLTESKQVEREL
jgi:PAS domain S-box-containing protein